LGEAIQWGGYKYSNLTSVCFIDTINGWVTGEGGTIIHTTDGGGIVKVEETNNPIPDTYILSQNYPNPFNPTTRIRFSIPSERFTSLTVYDVLGSEIITLVDEEKPAGEYEVEFKGDGLTSGIYFYQIKAGDFIQTKKMVLLR